MGIEDLKEHQWKKGQSGNPNGYSRKRRITDRLISIIERQKLEDTIAITWLGAAMGDEKLLKGRKPNAAFFQMLLERLEGKSSLDHDDDNSGELEPRINLPRSRSKRKGGPETS